MPKDHVKSISDKLKAYSHLFTEHEVKAFLSLANEQEEEHEEGEAEAEAPARLGKRNGTLAERVLAVLEDLEANLHASLSNLEQNEIAAAWELAGWLASSRAEIDYLRVEFDRAHVRADRLATVNKHFDGLRIKILANPSCTCPIG
jgi:hypothetical protein